MVLNSFRRFQEKGFQGGPTSTAAVPTKMK